MSMESNNELIKFDLPKEQSSIIKVIGVGGGGSNAVNHMYRKGINGVNFVVCNTDHQALETSPVPNKISLGQSLTEGRGAGAKPEIGLKSAMESIDDITDILASNTKMVFITAGMGGGTGTGAAPVIAQKAREMGILTVGIVTVPFGFEGKRRKEQAELGVEELKNHVDTLLVISNDKLREMYGDLTLSNAFDKADDVLATAAKGISEIITVTGYINVDFEDVKTVMTNGGSAIMGSATAEGENRAIAAIEGALNSPLLNDNDIRGAKHILLYMTFGDSEITMDEMGEITDYIQDAAGSTEHMIFGTAHDPSLGNKIGVTLIATGFKPLDEQTSNTVAEKVTLDVVDKKQEEIVEKINEHKFASAEDENDFFQVTEVASTELNANEIEFVVEDRSEATVETPTAQIEAEEPKVEKISLFDDVEPTATNNEPVTLNLEYPFKDKDNKEKEPLFKTSERLQRIKEISMKLKTPSGLRDLENVPAYERRQMQLESHATSKDNNASKFSIGDESGEGFRLRENNSFLHDNVD